jgi:hypothetical protein
VKVHQIGLVGGEITPSLHTAVTLDKVKTGLAECRNFITFAHGGASYRPGTWFIAKVKDSTKKVRIIPFSYSDQLSFFIEAGEEYMRFYSNDAQIVHTASTVSAWATATGYSVSDSVKTGTTVYRCISDHTSGATTEPGVGVDWEDKWVQSTIVEVETQYDEDMLPDVRYVQSMDTMYLVHNSIPPQTLERYSATSWVMSDFDYKNGPFMDENKTDVTFTLASVSGSTGLVGESVDVTASSATFTSDDVGRWLKIRYTKGATPITSGSWDPPNIEGTKTLGSVDGNFTLQYKFAGETADVELQYSVDGGSTWDTWEVLSSTGYNTWYSTTGELRSEDYNDTTPQLRLYTENGVDPDTIYYRLSQEREQKYGYLEIATFTSTTVVRCTVKTETTVLSKALKSWSLGAWGVNPGYPGVVGFHDDRLLMANTPQLPFYVDMSCTGDYNNFDRHYPALDDDGITLPLLSRYVDDIRGVISIDDLIVLTASGEWKIGTGSESAAITPDNAFRKNQGFRGSANIEPLVAGSSILFVQAFGSVVRDLMYSWEKDKYDSTDRSIFASHLFEGHEIVDWCFQQSPWSVVWCVRDDGVLLGMTYIQEHDIWAWHRHYTDGEVEAIACAPGAEQDEVYLVVKRGDERYIERMGFLSEDLHLDASVIAHDGAATTTITGLPYPDDTVVRVIADEDYIGTAVVTSGGFTLAQAASKVIVGLNYDGVIKTIPLIYEVGGDISVGSRRRSTEVVLQLLESQGGYVGTDEDNLHHISYEENEGSYTGTVRTFLDSTYDYSGSIILKHSEPLPFTVLTWTVRVAHGD